LRIRRRCAAAGEIGGKTFAQIAKLTNGAHCKFAPGSARELADLLNAVAKFAVGGTAALADPRTDGERKLLGQLK